MSKSFHNQAFLAISHKSTPQNQGSNAQKYSTVQPDLKFIYWCTVVSKHTSVMTAIGNLLKYLPWMYTKRHKLKEKPYKCTLCKRAFAQSDNLKKHLQRHAGIKPHICNLCSLAFTDKGDLTKHIARSHDQDDAKSYECDKCEKSFKFKGNLRIHKAVRDPRKLFTCEQCNNKFSFMGINWTSVWLRRGRSGNAHFLCEVRTGKVFCFLLKIAWDQL